MTNCSDNTEALCIHGVPIKLGCLSCTPADISILELDAHVKSLREHNLRHINENRKISRRVDELERLSKFNMSEQVQQVMNSGFTECKERIEKLESEKLTQQLDPKVWVFVNDRLDKLEECFKLQAYRNKCDIESHEIINEKIEKLEKLLNSYGRKIHKCPVCKGSGNLKGIDVNHHNFDLYIKYVSCHSCDGKGIIWR